jgi:hypothetical protein
MAARLIVHIYRSEKYDVGAWRYAVFRPPTLTAEVRLDDGKTSVFQHRTGRWLEIRRVRFPPCQASGKEAG